jgi:hypothetical protein
MLTRTAERCCCCVVQKIDLGAVENDKYTYVVAVVNRNQCWNWGEQESMV